MATHRVSGRRAVLRGGSGFNRDGVCRPWPRWRGLAARWHGALWRHPGTMKVPENRMAAMGVSITRG